MSSTFKITKWYYDDFGNGIMKDGARPLIEELTEGIRNRAGSDHYRSSVTDGAHRCRGHVTINKGDYEAWFSNQKHNTLLKAIKG